MKRNILIASILIASSSFSVKAFGQTYNVNTAFKDNELNAATETSSVFGPFSVGYLDGSGLFTPFTAAEHTNAFAGNGNTQGFLTNNNVIVPAAVVNVSTEPASGFSGLDAGEILLHPGGRTADGFTPPFFDGAIRFVAPAGGAYNLTGAFRSLDGGVTDNRIFQNGVSKISIIDGGAFNFTLQLAAGDRIDFASGAFTDGIGGDSTGLRATLAQAVGAQPTHVNIDLNGFRPGDASSAGTYVGFGAGGGGNVFNGITLDSSTGNDNLSASATNLLNSFGTPTGINFSLGPVGGDAEPGTPPVPPANSSGALFGDYGFVGSAGQASGTSGFTISGLGSATKADLYFYYPFAPATIVVGSEAPDPFAGNGVFSSGNTIFFSDVPVVGGSIVGTINGFPGVVSGLSVVVVPEPSSAALVGLVAAAAMLRRRRAA